MLLRDRRWVSEPTALPPKFSSKPASEMSSPMLFSRSSILAPISSTLL